MDSRLRTPDVIYDFFAEIIRPKDGEEAQIKSIFPKDYEWTEEMRKQFPKFVWPMRGPNDKEEHFAFVLTDLDSKYKFGFCRYPPKGETCMCFISNLPWYKVFYRALDKISDLLLDHQLEVVEPFLKGLHSHPLPNPGVDTILSVVPSEVDAGQVYSFPLPNPKKLAEIPTDDNLTQFYTNLHYNVILHLFANMIFERRIIITSSSLSMLSATVHGAVLLLYPLHWQHIFIPITPPHLLDYCSAPMPFLIGVHSSYMDIVRRMPTDDIVILDVDESTIESAHVDDLATLPSDVVSTLKHVLKKQSSAYGDTVTRSFLLAQVAMIGGYRSALKFRQGEKEVVFDEEQFLKSRPNTEEFLEQLLHFQHFRQFINTKIDKLKNSRLERDLFDTEVMTYEEEMKGAEQVKAVFEKFISSTVEGSKKFAELSGKLGGNIKRQVKQARIVMKKNLKSKPQSYGNRYFDQHIQQGGLNHSGNSFSSHEKKANTLPSIHKPVPNSFPTHGVTTPPPNLSQIKLGQTKPRRPPSVIPYQRHLEGKRKLVESLKQQSASDVSAGALFNFTPPDTPKRLSSNADQSSLDQGERLSLGSKGGGEEAVTEMVADDCSSLDQGERTSLGSKEEGVIFEVVVGNLIDLHADSGSSAVENSPNTNAIVDSISSSSFSTTSSTGISDPLNTCPPSNPPPIHHHHDWEQFDEEDESLTLRPRLPPPRSELEEFDESLTVTTPVDFVIDSPSPSPQPSLNPFAELESDRTASKSPLEDFSSSIAEALINNSEQRLMEDPTSASALVDTGKKLFETIQEETPHILDSLSDLDSEILSSSATIVTESNFPCHPTSKGSVTTAATTTQARTNLINFSHNPHLRTASSSKVQHPTQSVLRPIPQEGTFSLDSIASNTNPFYSGSVNAGNYPPLTPLTQRPSGPRSPSFVQDYDIHVTRENGHNVIQRLRKLPPKPQPYSGDYHPSQPPENQALSSNFNSSNDEAILRRQNSAFKVQRLPSLGVFDPFGDLLHNEGGMAGYVLENTNAPSLQ